MTKFDQQKAAFTSKPKSPKTPRKTKQAKPIDEETQQEIGSIAHKLALFKLKRQQRKAEEELNK